MSNLTTSLLEQIKNLSTFITFDEEAHIYSLKKNNQELSSVSSVINDYTPVFDKISVARHVADRDNIDVQEVLESWKIRRDFSAVKGGEFHLYVSVFLTKNRKLPVQTPIDNHLKAFHKFWGKNRDRFRIIATEFFVYDEQCKMAGTIDCLAQRVDTQDFVVFDWKTNKNIRMKNAFYETFKKPLEHLDHCEYNRFSLQLSFYRLLLKKALNLSVEKAFFVQFNENQEYTLCEAACFDAEVANILEIRESSQH